MHEAIAGRNGILLSSSLHTIAPYSPALRHYNRHPRSARNFFMAATQQILAKSLNVVYARSKAVRTISNLCTTYGIRSAVGTYPANLVGKNIKNRSLLLSILHLQQVWRLPCVRHLRYQLLLIRETSYASATNRIPPPCHEWTKLF